MVNEGMILTQQVSIFIKTDNDFCCLFFYYAKCLPVSYTKKKIRGGRL